jgi:hypothetical protein
MFAQYKYVSKKNSVWFFFAYHVTPSNTHLYKKCDQNSFLVVSTDDFVENYGGRA